MTDTMHVQTQSTRVHTQSTQYNACPNSIINTMHVQTQLIQRMCKLDRYNVCYVVCYVYTQSLKQYMSKLKH